MTCGFRTLFCQDVLAPSSTGRGSYLGGCQNYGPFLGTLNISCRIIIRTQNGTPILTTTHLGKRGEDKQPHSPQRQSLNADIPAEDDGVMLACREATV